MTALEVEQKNRTATYADCFRNNESRNGFRTWTGIMLQAVCFLSIPLRYEWSNVVLVAATNGYQFHLCVFQGKKFLLLYWLLFAWKLAYYGTVSSLPSRIQVIYTYIEHTDLLSPSRDRQRFPNSVCKPSLLTQTSCLTLNIFSFQSHNWCSQYCSDNLGSLSHRPCGTSSSPPHWSHRNVCLWIHHSHRWSDCWQYQSRHSSC